MNQWEEDRLYRVRCLLREAQQAPSMLHGDVLVARAANILQGVVARQAKVVPIETAKQVVA